MKGHLRLVAREVAEGCQVRHRVLYHGGIGGVHERQHADTLELFGAGDADEAAERPVGLQDGPHVVAQRHAHHRRGEEGLPDDALAAGSRRPAPVGLGSDRPDVLGCQLQTLVQRALAVRALGQQIVQFLSAGAFVSRHRFPIGWARGIVAPKDHGPSRAKSLLRRKSDRERVCVTSAEDVTLGRRNPRGRGHVEKPRGKGLPHLQLAPHRFSTIPFGS
jgi:hypothetical protein